MPADLDRVAAAVRRAARSADVVVVLPHWGTQYTHAPEPIQRTVARRWCGAGADLVVGGHPHWVQSVERSAACRCCHSLGNFVFDMDFMTQTMEGVVLEAVWRRRAQADPARCPTGWTRWLVRAARGARREAGRS